MYGDVFVGMRTIERLIVDEFVLVFFGFSFQNFPALISPPHQSLLCQYLANIGASVVPPQ